MPAWHISVPVKLRKSAIFQKINVLLVIPTNARAVATQAWLGTLAVAFSCRTSGEPVVGSITI